MSIWQTQSWQDMLIASWQSEEYFIIEQNIENSQKPSPIFVEKRSVALGQYGLFVIGFEWELSERLQENLRELCAEENCLFVQIETINYSIQPLSLEKGENSRESWNLGERAKREGAWIYYKKFIPPYTALIDLSQSEDDILAAMKPKGRYNIRLAKKKGVEVKRVQKISENIDIFYNLIQETTSRDSFAGNTKSYYELFLSSMEHAELYFAFHEDEVLAAGIFVRNEDVMIYYYGASSNHKRNLMAPYLLQWQVIESAKTAWCTLYDFLGVAGDNEPTSSLTGVTDFKMKLAPKKHFVSHSTLFIHKKWMYTLIQILKKIKK